MSETPRGQDPSTSGSCEERPVPIAYTGSYIPGYALYNNLGIHRVNLYYANYVYLAGRGWHHVNPPYSYFGHNGQSSFATAGIGESGTEVPLPRNACSTLFVQGFPVDCTLQEATNIFRPFIGFTDLRLVMKESGSSNSGPALLCFADFSSPAHAAAAMDALQGFKFYKNGCNPAYLRIQFSRPTTRPLGRRHGNP